MEQLKAMSEEVRLDSIPKEKDDMQEIMELLHANETKAICEADFNAKEQAMNIREQAIANREADFNAKGMEDLYDMVLDGSFDF